MTSTIPSKPGAGERLGTFILFLFFSCFAVVGLVTAVLAVRAFLADDFRQGGILSVVALTFGGVGFGMMVFTVEGRKRARKALELRSAFPSEPWKWREDWSAGAVPSTTKRTMWFAWAFSILWNLISIPLLFVLPTEILDKGNYPALLGLLFPLVGIGLLVWAVRETLEWRTFGQSVFRMESVPGVIGGEMSGTVDIPASFDPGQVFDARLTCVNRRTTGSGKNSSTSERILWEDKQESVRSLARPEAMGSGLAVRFAIPPDCLQTDDTNPNDRILWRLETHAAVPGVDYDATFDVPVFHTPASRAGKPGEESPEEPPAQYQPSADAGISFDVSPAGGTVVLVRPARAIGAILALGAFLVVWTGVVVLLVHLDAPFFFPLLFGLFDFLLVYGFLQLAIGSYRIVIEGGFLTLDNAVAGISFKTVMPLDEIETIKPSIGMQSGKTVFYSILVTRRGGRRSTLHVPLREKHDAEWLAAELRKRAGIHTPVPQTSLH